MVSVGQVSVWRLVQVVWSAQVMSGEVGIWGRPLQVIHSSGQVRLG